MLHFPRARTRRLVHALAIACGLAITAPTQAFVPAVAAGAALSAAAKWCWNQVVSWQAGKVLDRVAGSDHQAQLERSLVDIQRALSTANAAEREILFEQKRLIDQTQEMVRRVLQVSQENAAVLRKDTAAFHFELEQRLQAIDQKIAALEAKDRAHDAKDAEHDARLDQLERRHDGRTPPDRSSGGCVGADRLKRVGSKGYFAAGDASSVFEDWHPRGACMSVHLDACNPDDGAPGLLISLDLTATGRYGNLQGSIALGRKVVGLKYSVADRQPTFFFDYATLAPSPGRMDFSLKLMQGGQLVFEIPSKEIECGPSLRGCRWVP